MKFRSASYRFCKPRLSNEAKRGRPISISNPLNHKNLFEGVVILR